MLKIHRSLCVAALVLGLATAPSLSQLAGDLDASFASGGIHALLPESGGELYARAVKVDDSGRIVVVGTAFEPSFVGPVVVRLDSDGLPDSGFGDPGDPGVVRVQFPPAALVTPEQVPVISVEASDFVIDDQGRIVAVGLAQLPGGNQAFAAFRLSASGLLDETFGQNGLSLFKWGPAQDRLLAVELQRTGNRQNLVAAGLIVDEGRRNRFAVTRLTPDGSLDPSFGTGGLVVEDFPDWGFSIASDLLIENNRDIVLVGRVLLNGRSETDFLAVALRRDGALDTRFGGGAGWVAVDFDRGFESGFGAAFDGRDIVAVGYSSEVGAVSFPFPFDIAVVKLTRQGELDGSFGVGGKLRVNLASPTENAWAVQVQADGKIVAAGRSTVPGVEPIDIAVVRILPDGELDPDFGSGGFVKTDYSEWDEAYAAALQPDGKIVVAGYGGAEGPGFGATTTADMLVARYLGLASLQTELDSLQGLVREMAGDGMIQRRRARSLVSKLDLASYFLDRDGERVALQLLRLFRVETVMATTMGQIEPGAGAELVEQIDVLIAAIRSR